jgi:diaminohydroxyphosphoribosylaminopyrimidine deaminase / 5-amino-6-(5-phosphoribosylamino)uracil reductase
VAGKGIALLRQAGIEVIENVLAEEGTAFYRHFAHFILMGRPRIILKIAQSREGAINAGPGQPAALTGKAAQRVNHRLRVEADAWLIGAGTLRSDNPLLTPRLVKGPSPEALVLSRGGAKSLRLASQAEIPRLFLCAETRKVRLLAQKRPRHLPKAVAFTRLPPDTEAATPAPLQGKSPVSTRAASRRLVRFLLDDFKKRGYHLVVIEGGRGAWMPFLKEMAFDELWLFSSPVSLPQGEKWAEGLPQKWDKSLVFRSFTPLGKDQLTVFSRGE